MDDSSAREAHMHSIYRQVYIYLYVNQNSEMIIVQIKTGKYKTTAGVEI